MVNGFGPRSVARRLGPAGSLLVGTARLTRADDGPVASRARQLRAAARLRHRQLLQLIDPPGPHGRATEISTLPGAARRFLTHPRPPVLLGVVGTLAAARLTRGDFRRSDAAVALGFAAAQPFVEWGIHRYVLHAAPTGRLGRAAYQSAGWGHAQHHEDPANLNSMFMRGQDVLGAGALALAAGAFGSPRVSTGMLCLGVAVLAYDWTHFLIHTRYQPTSELYRRIWRSHRLHHFRNERYWLGVTSPVADLVLRTNPAREDVPVSAAAAHPEIHPVQRRAEADPAGSARPAAGSPSPA
ncbi:sterol desaturase family protein [Frankia sp. AgB1.9]|uniref:sterol desaturase family protein n=1 Tax=unclassified Frankia TaxID=2632575 RepID=UPI0019329951|nr:MULTISPECIES: sterol desaturase family protein [unclassified Frankia]MBL7486956.1 sterol desaturase family protein [Frankia sp. AgW1.1]MBL7552870.1 sterol desaturase family protein [Frankia sp. AgB1.9]MBL7625374.1 sterol desaturase family protein [Frankia sp. AgB1.8]